MGSQRVGVTFTFTLQELEVGGKWACGLRFLGFFFFFFLRKQKTKFYAEHVHELCK